MSIATTETTRLPLGQLRTDGGTQIRAKVDQRVVEEYAEQMASPETEFPPVIVFDDGHDCWLADGFHRVAAAARAQLADIACEVRPGSRREAILYAVGANSSHGLRRTNEDKRRAVRLLLADDEWTQKSDRWIAERCGVSNSMVSYCRAQLSNFDSCHIGQSGENRATPSRLGRDGKPRRAPRKRKPTPETASVEADPPPAADGTPHSMVSAAMNQVLPSAEADSPLDEPLAIYLGAITRLRQARGALNCLWRVLEAGEVSVENVYYERIIDEAMEMLWVACRNTTDCCGQPFPLPNDG